MIKKIRNKIFNINQKIFLFIKTPRLTFLIFQIRYVERYLKLDLFFFTKKVINLFYRNFFIKKRKIHKIN